MEWKKPDEEFRNLDMVLVLLLAQLCKLEHLTFLSSKF